MPDATTDFLKGTLDLMVLKTLSWAPAHGYGIARWIEQCTGDVLQVEEGSLYPALHKLEERGLILAEVGDHGAQPAREVLSADSRREKSSSHCRATTGPGFAGAVFKVLETAPTR
jgi:hypothetical protein